MKGSIQPDLIFLDGEQKNYDPDFSTRPPAPMTGSFLYALLCQLLQVQKDKMLTASARDKKANESTQNDFQVIIQKSVGN